MLLAAGSASVFSLFVLSSFKSLLVAVNLPGKMVRSRGWNFNPYSLAEDICPHCFILATLCWPFAFSSQHGLLDN
ncbi:hypothetical protein BR93DRAFT_344747 [Coniochaeta sp. PMI_546]|nr:hypothetical protein BR93DRAFT_344747 [Coniochaeta sp. PMI_546]